MSVRLSLLLRRSSILGSMPFSFETGIVDLRSVVVIVGKGANFGGAPRIGHGGKLLPVQPTAAGLAHAAMPMLGGGGRRKPKAKIGGKKKIALNQHLVRSGLRSGANPPSSLPFFFLFLPQKWGREKTLLLFTLLFPLMMPDIVRG